MAQNGIAGHPLDETDEKEIASIAADLERRYGKSYSGSGNGARSMHNEYDKGSGYDENDGFIDNSEAVSNDFDYFYDVRALLVNAIVVFSI